MTSAPNASPATPLDWDDALARCSADAATGLRIAHLSGDAKFSTYLARIEPGSRVRAHVHAAGDEHYHVLEGEGTLILRDLAHGDVAQGVTQGLTQGLTQSRGIRMPIGRRQSFVIGPHVAHELLNTGPVPLLLLFSCPQSNLAEDREFLDRGGPDDRAIGPDPRLNPQAPPRRETRWPPRACRPG